MKIVLGSANFGFLKYGIKNKKKIDNKQIKKILEYANKYKINEIDTALSYRGVYRNLNNNNLKNFNISTKFNIDPKKSLDYHKKKILNSLKKIKKKKYNIIFFHNLSNIKDKKFYDIVSFLKELKKKKIIRKIGFSLNSVDECNQLFKKFIPDIIQVPVNLLDRRMENFYYKNKSFINSKKIKFQARSVFLQGLLLMNKDERKTTKFYKKNIFLKLDKWCDNKKISKLKVCLNYIFSLNFLSSIVLGVDNVANLKEIIVHKKNKKYPKKIFSKDINLIEPFRWKK